MNKPICEDLVTRQSPQPDYLEIGVLSADGQTFTPVSVVGTGLPRESQLYFVAAEGGCSIRGQDLVGTVAVQPAPEMVPENAQPLMATVAPPQTPAQPTTPGVLGIPEWAVWALILVVIGGGMASVISRRQTKRRDSAPGQNYEVRLNDDGR